MVAVMALVLFALSHEGMLVLIGLDLRRPSSERLGAARPGGRRRRWVGVVALLALALTGGPLVAAVAVLGLAGVELVDRLKVVMLLLAGGVVVFVSSMAAVYSPRIAAGSPNGLADALAVATWLNVFIRQSWTVRMANQARLVNALAPIVTSANGLFSQAIYHPFRLMAAASEQVAVDTYTDSGAHIHHDRAGDRWPHRVGDLGLFQRLDVAATADPGRSRLTLSVVNRDPRRSIRTRIRLLDATATGVMGVHEVSGDSPDAVSDARSATASAGRLVISTVTRRSVSQRLISVSWSTVQTIVLIPARWHCATTPAAARRRWTATQSARQARSLRIGSSSLSRVAARLDRGTSSRSRPSDSAVGTAGNRALIAATERSSSVVTTKLPAPRMSSAISTTCSSPPVSFRSRCPVAFPAIIAITSATRGTG